MELLSRNLEQTNLFQLEFEQIAVEGLEQVFRSTFDDGAADLICIGFFRVDKDDGLAAPGGAAYALDEFAGAHAAEPVGGDHDIGRIGAAMLQRGIGRGGLGHVEPILTEQLAQSLPLLMILIDKQTSCHVDYSFQTHPQPAVIAFKGVLRPQWLMRR